MKNGFYLEMDQIAKDLEDELEEYISPTFEFMESICYENKDEKATINEINAYDFLHGFCYEFALVLNQLYGYEIECILDENNELVHAYCIIKNDNNNVYIDIRGITTDYHLFIKEFDDWIEYFNIPTYPLPKTMPIKKWEQKEKDCTPYPYALEIAKKIIEDFRYYKPIFY